MSVECPILDYAKSKGYEPCQEECMVPVGGATCIYIENDGLFPKAKPSVKFVENGFAANNIVAAYSSKATP